MWNKLYNAAVKVQNSRTISPFIDAGSVAAAILTKQGNIYVEGSFFLLKLPRNEK